MKIFSSHKIFCGILVLFAAACLLPPVLADNGTITIAYRGSGGSYIGETVVFDGKDTYGNAVLLKVTGPGLPSEGVPVNNLNGPPGTGMSVEVDQYGAWKYAWYASSVPGIEKLKTGRYTFTATDLTNPEKSATTLFMLKKPEYSITASPNPVNPGKYVELNGIAERGITTAKIEIKDASGAVLHSFTSPVSSSGYFNYGLHVDMGPGQYAVTVSNPALKAPFGTVLSVVGEEGSQPVATAPAPAEAPVVPTTAATLASTLVPSGATTTARSPAAPATALAALMAGIIVLGISRHS